MARPAGTTLRAVNEDPFVIVTLKMPSGIIGRNSLALFGNDSRLLRIYGSIAAAPTNCLREAKMNDGEYASPILMKIKEVPQMPSKPRKATHSLRFRVRVRTYQPSDCYKNWSGERRAKAFLTDEHNPEALPEVFTS